MSRTSVQVPETDTAADLARLREHVGTGRRGNRPPDTPARRDRGDLPPGEIFTQLHKFCADIVADMLVRGGHRQDVNDLLVAIASHHWREKHQDVYDPDQRDEAINRYVGKKPEKWYEQLSANWPQRGKSEAVDSESLSDRIRARMKRRADVKFARFLAGASPEEIELINRVLDEWDLDQESHSTAETEPQIAIANAFAAEILESERYIRVPSEQWLLVEKYLDLLKTRQSESD